MSYRFRRPGQDDLPAVIELVRALWRADGDEGDPTFFIKGSPHGCTLNFV